MIVTTRSNAMFDGFSEETIATEASEVYLRRKGQGEPLLLLHGYPQTHVTWHKVAPALADQYTVVVPDLPGYGRSTPPPFDDDHIPYSKRAMAKTMVEMMHRLGYERFTVIGHDRGARVAYRMALDTPTLVDKLVSLDVMPTIEYYDAVTRESAYSIYHWFFLSQPHPFPETLISGDPDYFLHHTLHSWARTPEPFDVEAMAAYAEAFRQPTMIRATCEDYRAGITRDVEHDCADQQAGTKITCPMLVLWGARRSDTDMLAVWRRWAENVQGTGLDCGHFLPEEAPDETIEHLMAFLNAER